jgi:DNA helicase II / ATP-dependent DNA helicase PcrA
MTFTPSTQQLSIGDALLHSAEPHPNIIVEAVAGSGKTTTIVWLVEQLPQRRAGSLLPQQIVFLAFNKAIADTLAARCPKHVQCSTFHSLGFRALKGIVGPRVKVEGRKVPKLVWDRLDRHDPDVQNTIKLVSLCKAMGVKALPEAPTLRVLADRYDINCEDEKKVFHVVEEVLEQSNADLSQIDFDDMLYLPVLLNAPFTPMDWVFVDEAQDTNDIQVAILERLAKPRSAPQAVNSPIASAMEALSGYATLKPFSPTTFVFVGDPRQAIYGFRGANSDAMEKVARKFSCQTFPLSVSYRCPKLVVAEAQKFHI